MHGMRLGEGLRLRAKDVDVSYDQITSISDFVAMAFSARIETEVLLAGRNRLRPLLRGR
jgi:hypothetical protein